jgi:hypothetical protein
MQVGPKLRALLFFYAFVFGIYMGGGLFETVVIAPIWSASAEAARHFNQDPLSIINSGNFFFIVAPLTLVTSIVALIAGWRTEQPLRFWLRLQIFIFLLTFLATVLYYVPEQTAIKGMYAQTVSDMELTQRAGLWITLNWVRFAVALVLWGMLLHVLGLSYRHSERTPLV